MEYKFPKVQETYRVETIDRIKVDWLSAYEKKNKPGRGNDEDAFRMTQTMGKYDC